MILERELYKSISTTRAVSKSLRAYFYTSLAVFFKEKSPLSKNDRDRGLPQLVSPLDCNGCGDCASVCPTSSLEVIKDNDKLRHFYLDVKKCIFCGLCEDICDSKAIKLNDYRKLASHGESVWKIDLADEIKQS